MKSLLKRAGIAYAEEVVRLELSSINAYRKSQDIPPLSAAATKRLAEIVASRKHLLERAGEIVALLHSR